MEPWRDEALKRGYRSSAAVPFKRHGRVVGALSVYASEPQVFTEDDEVLLNQIGQNVSFALDSMDAEQERVNAEHALNERFKEITCLYSIHHEMGLDLSQDELCQRIVNHLVHAMQYPDITVPFIELDGEQFTTEAWHAGLSHEIRAAVATRSRVHGYIAVYYSEDKPFILPEEQALLDAIAEGLRLWLERKQARLDLARQLEKLRALRSIDQAIVTSTDLTSILEFMADEIILQLNVDAVTILLPDAQDETLVFAVGRGFHTDALRHSRLKIGQGLAGKAALERHRICEQGSGLGAGALGEALSREQFVYYCGVPLIANERLRGVLEIFHRSQPNADEEWMELLESLAKQAAIAIDKARLFNDLQDTNARLSLAYDSTLEGWSHALDLRDKETEGHTRRVTEMTLQLAQKFGIVEPALTHVRRGALLHDIGKMGIPDVILLKPGPLTEEEWKVMRKHPAYAYEMLLPIEYLKPSIDIPYCHHERWDGSGYPRRLKGEEIPLPARIFAIVDVWDALTSERPYRSAWSKEKTFEYIFSQSGSHFDPQVVDIFARFIKERNPAGDGNDGNVSNESGIA
jgi:HD-GYP domain-containing protein (c-di-GMP phosphodiesterase class II)